MTLQESHLARDLSLSSSMLHVLTLNQSYILLFSFKIVQSLSKPLLFIYNFGSLLFLNAQYTMPHPPLVLKGSVLLLMYNC